MGTMHDNDNFSRPPALIDDFGCVSGNCVFASDEQLNFLYQKFIMYIEINSMDNIKQRQRRLIFEIIN